VDTEAESFTSYLWEDDGYHPFIWNRLDVRVQTSVLQGWFASAIDDEHPHDAVNVVAFHFDEAVSLPKGAPVHVRPGDVSGEYEIASLSVDEAGTVEPICHPARLSPVCSELVETHDGLQSAGHSFYVRYGPDSSIFKIDQPPTPDGKINVFSVTTGRRRTFLTGALGLQVTHVSEREAEEYQEAQHREREATRQRLLAYVLIPTSEPSFFAWRHANMHAFVLPIPQGDAASAKLHHADCRHLSPGGSISTSVHPSQWFCAPHFTPLIEWFRNETGIDDDPAWCFDCGR
jgi:hypothetical protein